MLRLDELAGPDLSWPQGQDTWLVKLLLFTIQSEYIWVILTAPLVPANCSSLHFTLLSSAQVLLKLFTKVGKPSWPVSIHGRSQPGYIYWPLSFIGKLSSDLCLLSKMKSNLEDFYLNIKQCILILLKNYTIWSHNLVLLLLKKRTLFSKIGAVSAHESKSGSCS